MKRSLLTLSLLTSLANAQPLKSCIEEVIATNPVVQERLKNYNAAKEDLSIAKSGYYPKLDLSLGFGIEKTEKSAQLNPANNQSYSFSVYQNSLKLTQNIFKGWDTTYQVEGQEAKSLSSAYSYVEKVNDIAFQMVNAYIQVMKQRELLENSKSNVEINEEIFKKVQKLYEAGLTTLSEVNKIESSLALAKSNYVVQENTLLDTLYSFQKLLGRTIEPAKLSKPELTVAMPASLEEALTYAIENNPSLLVSQYNIKTAQATYNQNRSPFYPHIDIEISESMNKNLSAVEGEDTKFRAMVYLNYNIFNGFADSATLQKSISQVHQEVESKNELRRQVIEGLSLSWAANEKLKHQLDHLVAYKDFSLKTLTLYAKEYDLGRRSLLDLLSAQNDFIGAKSQIINTEYSLLYAKYRILDALGTLVPTVLGDEELVYSNVGLAGAAPSALDSLPLRYDRDNDLIADDADLCANSLPTEMKNIFGCAESDLKIAKIERYGGFTFKSDSSELTSEGEENLDNLIRQLTILDISKMRFDLLSNIDNPSLTEEIRNTLCNERALLIKDRLVAAGALEEAISFRSYSDKAPLFTNESSYGTAQNNRVDIIVKKYKN